VALPKPTEREQGQWYFQRYIANLPAAGEIVLFDRSWYNRAGVERVMGYASEDQVRAFLAQAPAFEKLLVTDGLLLFKYWLTCDQEEQERRFAERRDDPMKRWKLSRSIWRRAARGLYRSARGDAGRHPHARSPWTLVDFNDQRRGRLTVIRNLLDRMPDTRVDVPPLDLPPLKDKPLAERFGLVEPLHPYPKA
jgi:polyphosphate kinase 2 (PPK2 family)